MRSEAAPDLADFTTSLLTGVAQEIAAKRREIVRSFLIMGVKS
jgi:hypothetical protein